MGCCAKGGAHFYGLCRCNGEHWRRRMATVLLDYSNWTHYRSSQGHAAPGIDDGHRGVRLIFDGSDEFCLCRPTANSKSRRINLRWRLPCRGCLSFIRSPVYGPRYLLGARSRDLTSIVRQPSGLGRGRKGRQNGGTAHGRPQKSVADCDTAKEQHETEPETKGHREPNRCLESPMKLPVCAGVPCSASQWFVVAKAGATSLARRLRGLCHTSFA
jgi:hypothetical protein